MIKKVLFIIFISWFLSCNENLKNDLNLNKQTSNHVEKVRQEFPFENDLLDLRDINDKLNDNLKVDKFGMQKINDSIFAFVFKLDNQTTGETIKQYSFGIKGYSSELDAPFLSNFSPILSVVENQKYLVLKRKIKNTRYFDSLDIYIYERKNWKKSGKLGGIIIRDILFE